MVDWSRLSLYVMAGWIGAIPLGILWIAVTSRYIRTTLRQRAQQHGPTLIGFVAAAGILTTVIWLAIKLFRSK